MRLFDDVSVRVADPHLSRACLLAAHARGATSPNPMVGCVIVSPDDVIVGEGFHAKAGTPHAEVVALLDAGVRAKGATAYVTLEPCNHVGRTPPCTEALIEAGIRSVVIGMRDPNVAVSGGGARRLQEAGLDVRFAEDRRPFENLNESWLHWLRTGRPWVRVKAAMTLDGHATLAPGKRSRVTGEGGRNVTMRLRAAASAVAVGASTALIDDPLLTVRDVPHAAAQPLRVVIARTSCPSSSARVFDPRLGPAMLIASDDAPAEQLDALQDGGLSVGVYPRQGGIKAALSVLGSRGVTEVLVEAGPGMLSALWAEGLIDELVCVQAGGMAGSGAPPLFRGGADEEGGDVLARMRAVRAGVAGNDAFVVWRPKGDTMCAESGRSE